MNYIDQFIHYLKASEASPETIGQYRRTLDTVSKHLESEHGLSLDDGRITQTESGHFIHFIETLTASGKSVATRNSYISILRSYFHFLNEAEQITKNPVRVIHKIKEKRKADSVSAQKMFTLDDIDLLMNYFMTCTGRRNRERDCAVVALILASGMRASEACSIDVGQLDDLKNGLVVCKRKGGHELEVAVADFCIGYIERYLAKRKHHAPQDPLFLSQKGGRLHRKALWNSLAAKQRDLDLKTGIHRLRHSFLTAIENDEDIYVASKAAGHASIATTTRYSHGAMDRLQSAVNKTSFAQRYSTTARLTARR